MDVCSEYSKQLNEMRINVLKAKEAAIQELLSEAKAKLKEVSKNPANYKKLMTDLLVQVRTCMRAWGPKRAPHACVHRCACMRPRPALSTAAPMLGATARRGDPMASSCSGRAVHPCACEPRMQGAPPERSDGACGVSLPMRRPPPPLWSCTARSPHTAL